MLILLTGPAGAFGAYAVVAFSSLVAVSRIQPAPRSVPSHVAPRETLLQRVAGGIRHARERPPALLALALVAATSILGASYPANPYVLAAVLDPAASQQTLIVLASANGVGSFIGVINVARRPRSVRLQSTAAELLVLGALLPFVGLSRHVAVTVILVAVCGGLSLSVFTAVNTLLQQLVDDAQRGRVMSLYFMCWGGLLPFGGLGLGALAGQFSVTAGLIIFGVLAALAASEILHRSRRSPQPDKR